MAKRAYAACNRSGGDVMRCNRSGLARGYTSQMSDDISTLKRSLDAEAAESSSEETTVGSKADESDVTDY